MYEEEKQILRRYGIRVAQNQYQEVLKIINTTPSFKEEFDKIRTNLKNLNDQDHFLNQILKNHRQLMTDKIVLKQYTYHIQAINPEDISSLTQRAFFKSFNVQKNKLNDLTSQKNIAPPPEPQEPTQNYTQIFKVNTLISVQEEIFKDPIVKTIQQNTDKTYCFCGKQLQTQKWVQCQRQNCKGSSWYHYQCVGFSQKDRVQQQTFVCNACKKYEQQHGSEKDDIKNQKGQIKSQQNKSQNRHDISPYDSGPQKKKKI